MRGKAEALCAILALSAALGGCTDAAVAPSQTQTTVDTTLAAVLKAHGFSAFGIRDLGTDVLVERDIIISKALIEKWRVTTNASPWSPNYQWSTNALVDQSQVQHIVVDLSGLSGDLPWQTAARNAMGYWNVINNSSVYLVEGSPGDITLTEITSAMPV